MIAKHFTETSNKVELRINRVRINHSRPVVLLLMTEGIISAVLYVKSGSC